MKDASTSPSKAIASYQCQFTGNATDLFVLFLKNAILTSLTFGIYAAWGKADLYRYHWSNAAIAGHRLRFTGTGSEIFKGLLLGLGLFSLLFLVYGFLETVYQNIFLNILAQLGLYVGLACLMQFAYYSIRRYRLSRTAYREIRFKLGGSPKEFLALSLKNLLLAVFTFGVMTPFFIHRRWDYVFNRMQFGNLQFRFKGDEKAFFFLCVKGFLLCLLTLGIYTFWFVPAVYRYIGQSLSLESLNIHIHMTAWDYFKITASNILILILTLGLGFAWVQIRRFRFFFESIQLEGNLDIESAMQIEQDKISAGSEGVAQVFDLDTDIGF